VNSVTSKKAAALDRTEARELNIDRDDVCNAATAVIRVTSKVSYRSKAYGGVRCAKCGYRLIAAD